MRHAIRFCAAIALGLSAGPAFAQTPGAAWSAAPYASFANSAQNRSTQNDSIEGYSRPAYSGYGYEGYGYDYGSQSAAGRQSSPSGAAKGWAWQSQQASPTLPAPTPALGSPSPAAVPAASDAAPLGLAQ